MRRWLPLTLTLFLLPIAAPVYACLNDRDTDALVNEGKNLPTVIQVITGRFERNPPLFYEMRIRHETEQIRFGPDDPTSLPYLYDDVAVAYDRLGKDDDAIAWIERKRRLIPEFARKYPSFVDKARLSDLWYRYHANCGTFWAHHWLRAGAKPERISEMETARQHIADALKINPNAHFGRERFQLRAMEWILRVFKERGQHKPTADDSGSWKNESLGDYLFKGPDHDFVGDKWTSLGNRPEPENPDAAVTGLSGLIVLGNAWESVDVFDALAQALYRTGNSRIGYMATLRVRELLRQGRKSLGPDPRFTVAMFTGDNLDTVVQREAARRPPGHRQTTEEKYDELRVDAERWQKVRTDYMLARLQQGHHPDLEFGREGIPDFWRDFPKTEPPSLDIPWYREWRENVGWFLQRNVAYVLMVYLVLLCLAVYAVSRLAVRFVRYVRARFRGV